MGNSISDQRVVPTSPLDCFKADGHFDLELYSLYMQRGADQEEEEDDDLRDDSLDDQFLECLLLAEAEMKENPPRTRRTRHRSVKRRRLYGMADANSGEPVELTPFNSPWYVLYVLHPDIESSKFQSKFRRRFRLPYSEFVDTCSQARSHRLFKRWSSFDAVGRSASPLELMILGALRYIGRGWTFDDVEEETCIDEETHRQFLHVFLMWGSTTLFDMYVRAPASSEEAAAHMHEMEIAGFHGCIGSTDATHVCMDRCGYRLANAHRGKKLSLPSRTFNLTVNHRRQILSSTTGHPARWNDKTLVLFDDFVKGIQDGKILEDVEFELLGYSGQANNVVARTTYKGVWLMVDNGYLRWPTTIPPSKSAVHTPEIRFSKWLESMRKDVECTFGILKGRFRILKTGVRLHGLEATDRIWLTCCALHNKLLQVDGLHEEWRNGRESDWEGDLGRHSSLDVVSHVPTPLRRLVATNDDDIEALQAYDTSGMGRGTDDDGVSSMASESGSFAHLVEGVVATPADARPERGQQLEASTPRRVRELPYDT